MTQNRSNISNSKSSSKSEVNPWLVGGCIVGGAAVGGVVGTLATRAYIKKKAEENKDLVDAVKAQMASGNQQG